MHQLLIEDIHCFAYHGCLKEESRIGGNFSVSVEMHLDLSKSVESDNLKDTADYVLIHRIVREEMAIPSKLIEHAAGRILKRLRKEIPAVRLFRVKVKKHNPPVNGQVGAATVVLEG
jgi:7,8-dihydroneopterin aldolase/epimerase/oxygenase